jgi:ribosomal protein S18 acetylase RimI-like enzyme
LLTFLYFRKRDYKKGFSIESGPLFVFVIVPYIAFSEVYFFRQRRYFVTFERRIVGVFALEDDADRVYISSLAVSPVCRRTGVATLILNYASEVARRLEKNNLELSVNKSNLPALKLYIRHGFRKKKERFYSYILRRDIDLGIL